MEPLGNPDRPSGCGGVCACRSSPSTEVGTTLLVGSSTGHTIRFITQLAERSGHRVNGVHGLCAVTGPDLEALVLAVAEVLTETEMSEARACFSETVADPLSQVAEAFAAPTLAQLAARFRHRDVIALIGSDEAFYSRYQPLVRMDDGVVVAHEALLRARMDGREVMPDALFGAAHAAGTTHTLDRIGRETALRGAAGWLGDDLLFVNFIPTSIYRLEVCLRTTERAARAAGVPMEQVVFEVTESARVADVAHLRRIFEYYRAQGCRVALDDVGAGYSSLNLLASLQPDVVKIDMALVQSLPAVAPTAVVRAIIGMSHGFGATVVAEGIETQEQADVVGELGADLGQGWLYGRPAYRAASATTSVEVRTGS